jgi:hypothetical protein
VLVADGGVRCFLLPMLSRWCFTSSRIKKRNQDDRQAMARHFLIIALLYRRPIAAVSLPITKQATRSLHRPFLGHWRADYCNCLEASFSRPGHRALDDNDKSATAAAAAKHFVAEHADAIQRTIDGLGKRRPIVVGRLRRPGGRRGR